VDEQTISKGFNRLLWLIDKQQIETAAATFASFSVVVNISIDKSKRN